MIKKHLIGRRELQTSPRRSAAEKAELKFRFKESRDRGQPLAEFAKEHRVSLSSVYRWIEEETKGSKIISSHEINIIENAIATLTQPECTSDLDRRDAIFRFAIWLRWPSSPEYYETAYLSLYFAYLQQTYKVDSLSQVPKKELNLACERIFLSNIARAHSPEALYFPVFREYHIDGKPFCVSNVLSDIVWFFHAGLTDTINSRKRPSLKKFHHLLLKEAFKYSWKISERTFLKEWARGGASSPFYYVQYAASGLDWSFDPLSPTFADDVNEMMESREDVNIYFSRCKFAVDMLRKRLDARAMERLSIPSLPKNLSMTPFDPEPLPNRVLAKLDLDYSIE